MAGSSTLSHTVIVSVFLYLFTELSLGQENNQVASNFTNLSNEYFDWRMSERPESSTSRGYHRYNDVLENFTLIGYNVSKSKADDFLQRLKAMPRDQLGRENRLNYDILNNMLTTYIDGFKWRLYSAINPINMLEGPQHNSEYFNTYLPFYTIGDYENYLSRLTRLPDQINQFIALFREAIRLRRTYHNVSMNIVFDQIATIEKACPPGANAYTTDCWYYTPFTDLLNNITATYDTRTKVRARGTVAIRKIVKSFGMLEVFLKTIYMPNSRTSYGIWSLDKGRELYQARLKWYLSLNLTPEEIHNIGLREVERIYAQMKKIMTRNGFRGTIREYFSRLQKDNNNFYKTSEEMLDGYRDLIYYRINPHLKELFKDPPNLPLEVKALTSDGPPGKYTPGSKDGSIPAVFWANVLRPWRFPKYAMLPLAMQEANLGNHLQASYELLSDLPTFRRKMESPDFFRVPFAFPVYTAFSEGWALYAEFLGEELNIYKDDTELMGRYSSEIFRACRLVVDTGIHYYKWTKEDAIDYFLNLTTMSRDDLSIEVDRYITWPGQACSYKIGELKIKEMRKFAEDTLGNKFDIREFHTSLMKAGSVPLDLMKRHIKEWVDDQLNSTPESSPPTCSSQINSVPSAVLYILFFGLMFQLCYNL